MTQSSAFRPYTLKAKISGYKNNPVLVKAYSYTLTQYTPSVYADICFFINDDDFLDFKDIDKLKIEDRIIEIWFESELYHETLKKSFNSGPFKYCIIKYNYTNGGINDVDTDYKGYKPTKMVTLKCVDPVFYKMSLDENIKSFGKVSSSEVVKKLISSNGGTAKTVIDTSYNYRWLQTSITDYEMIRSLLPYSKSSNGELLYTFYMFNKEAYFAPISTGKINPTKINLSELDNGSFNNYKTSDLKLLIEKYGSLDSLMIYDAGYSDFKLTKATAMNSEAYASNLNAMNQHKGVAKKYIRTSIDDKTLEQIYLSNIRHRIHTFSRLLSINMPALPELDPISCVEIIRQKDGQIKDLDGIYYIASVTYTYGMTQIYPIQPTMSLLLCSELDAKGSVSAEGKAIN